MKDVVNEVEDSDFVVVEVDGNVGGRFGEDIF